LLLPTTKRTCGWGRSRSEAEKAIESTTSSSPFNMSSLLQFILMLFTPRPLSGNVIAVLALKVLKV